MRVSPGEPPPARAEGVPAPYEPPVSLTVLRGYRQQGTAFLRTVDGRPVHQSALIDIPEVQRVRGGWAAVDPLLNGTRARTHAPCTPAQALCMHAAMRSLRGSHAFEGLNSGCPACLRTHMPAPRYGNPNARARGAYAAGQAQSWHTGQLQRPGSH